MNKQEFPKDQKTVLTIVAVAAVLSVAGLTVVASIASQQTNFSSEPPKASIVNLRGKTVCLTEKEQNQDTLPSEECVYGLEVASGVNYALMNIERKFDKPLRTGDHVTVTGTLEPPVENSEYEMAGIIAIDSIKLQEGQTQ